MDIKRQNKNYRGFSMKEITKLMTNKFKIMELGIDFMGYKVEKEIFII